MDLHRLWDNLSLEIRNGRVRRDEAISIIREHGDETPFEEIEKFCDWSGITQTEFFNKVSKFRNKNFWTRVNGRWAINGFLIEDWIWSNS